MVEKKDNTNDVINESSRFMIESKTFYSALFKSAKLLFLSKNLVFSMVITYIVEYFIRLSKVEITMNRIYQINISLGTLNLAMFGVVITGYAIFQAFLSSRLSIKLLEHKSNKYSLFLEFNMNFFSTSLLFLLLILIFLILDISESLSLANYLSLPSNLNRLEIKKFFLLMYLFFQFLAMLEVKSIIYNIYQAFNLNALQLIADTKSKKR